MKTQEQPPEPVQEEGSSMEEQPVLPPPEDRPTIDWAEKADRAREARELGRRLRRGKRVLFPSRRSMSG